MRKIGFSPPDISEREISEVINVLKSGWITTGPRTKLLERQLDNYIKTGDMGDVTDDTHYNKNDSLIDNNSSNSRINSCRTACFSSATAAEEMILRLIGVGPGDEVIVPAYTYTATASAVLHTGAKVVFVDIMKDGDAASHAPVLDYDALSDKITEKTKAIVAVDYGGILCDYKKIYSIVESKKSLYRYNLDQGIKTLSERKDSLEVLSMHLQEALGRVAVISDSAHALGAARMIDGKWCYSGMLADFTSFSFHAVKNLTTAEGGAVAWKDIYDISGKEFSKDEETTNVISNQKIFQLLHLMSNHGQDKDSFTKTHDSKWEYDIVGPWYKYNMTDIAAAIGLGQLRRYKDIINRREMIVRRYDELSRELGIFHINHFGEEIKSNYHLYPVRLPNFTESERNDFITKLEEKGIPTNVHFKPLPMMSAYKKLGYDINDYPNSYNYYRNLITLPLHTLLSDDDVEYICDVFEEEYTNYRRG